MLDSFNLLNGFFVDVWVAVTNRYSYDTSEKIQVSLSSLIVDILHLSIGCNIRKDW